MMEFLRAIECKREANNREMKAHHEKMDTDKAEIMAKMDKLADGQEELMMSRTETTLMMAEMKATIKSGHEEMIKAITEACLEKKGSTPEEIGAVAEPQEVPKGAMDEEAIGVTEHQSKNLRLAVGCRGRLKTPTKPDGQLRQECATAVGRPTRRSDPAMRKGGLRKGLGKKCCSGIRVPGRTLGSRMEGRSLKQRRPKYNMVRGAAKGRTCKERRRTRLECNDAIRGRGARQH
jgi:hypothetical protein